MSPCNKTPCSKPYVYGGHYQGDANLYCIPPEQKYILIMECIMACAPDPADPYFVYEASDPCFCSIGASSWWEGQEFEKFKCHCKPKCPVVGGGDGPVV